MPASRRKSRKSLLVKDNEDLSCCYNETNCPLQARQFLKDRLFNQNNDFFLSSFMEEQQRQLEIIVKQCISFGESNSVLVIGPRGSGKSKLVRKVLSDVSQNLGTDYFYLFLSGLIHTDDRAALQDMARQLELENVVGDRVFGSFSDNLSFILDALKDDSGKSKSVVIVMDEFDCFTYHKNQSLLYNLFDIAQSKQNPLCVIGITCRLDVVELLEKRVKSRYSHRSILTFPNFQFSHYLDYTRELLMLPETFSCTVFQSRWNRHIQNVLDETTVTNLFEKHFNIKKDIGDVVKLLSFPICGISSSHKFITSADISTSYSKLHTDTKAVVLNGLSILELCLIIAAKHVVERREGQPFNFEMIFNEYQAYSKRRSTGMQSFNKAVTFKAYEHLIALELLRCTESVSNHSLAKEYKPMCMLIVSSQIKETLQKYPECPTELKNWADYMYT